jgi:hypothetical protein
MRWAVLRWSDPKLPNNKLCSQAKVRKSGFAQPTKYTLDGEHTIGHCFMRRSRHSIGQVAMHRPVVGRMPEIASVKKMATR